MRYDITHPGVAIILSILAVLLVWAWERRALRQRLDRERQSREREERLAFYSDTVTIDQTRPGRLPGRAEAIRNSTFGKDLEARAFAALSGEAEAFTRGITLPTLAESAAPGMNATTIVGDPPGFEGSKDEKPLMYADMVKARAELREQGYREFGAAMDATQTEAAEQLAGTADALIREVEAKHCIALDSNGSIGEGATHREAMDALYGTMRQTDPDGTVAETTIPVSEKGEVHMLNVEFKPVTGEERTYYGLPMDHVASAYPKGPRIMGRGRPNFDHGWLIGVDFAKEEEAEKNAEASRRIHLLASGPVNPPTQEPDAITVTMDTVLPPIQYDAAAMADLRNHGVVYHRIALDEAGVPRFEHVPVEEVQVNRSITEDSMSWEPLTLRPENVGRYFGTEAGDFGLIAVDGGSMAYMANLPMEGDELERLLGEASGMILTSPPAGPARDADGLHPTNLRLRQQERQRRYWMDRITGLDPDLMDENNHSGPAEVVRALFRGPDGMDEDTVRRTVTQLAHEVAAYVPPRLAGPQSKSDALASAGELLVLADTRIHAHRKVEAIGNVAIALAQQNERLRTQAVAHFGSRLSMDTRGTEHSDVEVDDNPGARFAAMSRDEALAICESMGWVRPALGVGYTWVMD